MSELANFLTECLDEDERELVKDPPNGLGYACLPARIAREIAGKRNVLARYEDCLARMEDPDYPHAAARDQAREYEDFVLPNLALLSTPTIPVTGKNGSRDRDGGRATQGGMGQGDHGPASTAPQRPREPAPEPAAKEPARAVAASPVQQGAHLVLPYSQGICYRAEAVVAMSEVIIIRAVQTCEACPSQWDAWDLDGNYWYLRYRSSRGTAERQPGPDWETWAIREPNISFGGQDDDADGAIELERFCDLAGIQLALTDGS